MKSKLSLQAFLIVNGSWLIFMSLRAIQQLIFMGGSDLPWYLVLPLALLGIAFGFVCVVANITAMIEWFKNYFNPDYVEKEEEKTPKHPDGEI